MTVQPDLFWTWSETTISYEMAHILKMSVERSREFSYKETINFTETIIVGQFRWLDPDPCSETKNNGVGRTPDLGGSVHDST